MKKIYTILLATFVMGALTAQDDMSTSVSLAESGTCINFETGNMTVKWDVFQNCEVAEGDLTTMSAIGWHSGANTWANVVAWDDATAQTATDEDGDGVFEVEVNILEYYGVLALEDLQNVMMVFNQGAAVPDDPWSSAGRDPREGGGLGGECADLIINVADIADCNATATVDITLQNSLELAPTPFRDITYLSFANVEGRSYDLMMTDLSGQTIRRITNITDNQVQIERANLPAGMYFLHLIGAQGKIATTKLIAQ